MHFILIAFCKDVIILHILLDKKTGMILKLRMIILGFEISNFTMEFEKILQ